MDQNKFSLLKSHIDAFTRKDGTVVQAHDDKRVAAPPIATHADALARSSKPGDLDHTSNQIAAGYMKDGDHKALAGHIKNLDTAARDHILDHVHPDHREGLGFKQLNMDRSKKQYAEKFNPKTIAANAAEKASNAKKDAARKGAKDVVHKVGDKVHNVYHDFPGTVVGHTEKGHPIVQSDGGPIRHTADNHKEWQPAK